MRNLLTMIEEEFKEIKGYEGLYEVSNYGRVRSLNYLRTGETRVLVGYKNKSGYIYVALYKEGKKKKGRVHRLVAEAFIPNPYELPEVNHIDEDKTNNRADNLEWCNRKYNINYGTGHQRSAEKHINHPNLSKPVYQYTKSGAFVRSYPSVHEAARQMEINQGSISQCCLNRPRYKSAGGYIWSFNPPTDITPRSLW